MEEACIRALLAQHKSGAHERGTRAFDALTSILLHHPTWKDRLVAIQAARVRQRDTALLLQIRTKSRWFSVSWRACILRKRKKRADARPPEVKQLHEAMRTAVRTQLAAFRRGKRPVCAFCATSGCKLHVDHSDPPFKVIRDEFLGGRDRAEWPTRFGYGKRCASAFLPEHAAFKRAWQRYHARRAAFQLLCRDCNLRKGSSQPAPPQPAASPQASAPATPPPAKAKATPPPEVCEPIPPP